MMISPKISLRSRTVSLLAAIILLGLSAALAADFWEKKDYKEWTQKECQKILQDSPWAQDYKIFAKSTSSGDATEGQQYINYAVQLLSATPIRHAQVRAAQIQNKYDSLSPEQKQAFDKQTEGFLATPDKIIVNVAYSTNIQRLDMDLAGYWQTKVTSIFQNSVYLIPGKGKKVPLAEYKVAPGAQRIFQFIFPREFEGKPVLSPDDKSLILEFPYVLLRDMAGDGRGMVEFKVKKMVYNGQLEY